MSTSSEASGWVSIVPEIYFDLISRVPPGTLLALGIGWSVGAFNQEGVFARLPSLNAGWPGLITFLALFLPAGYVLGLLMTGLAKLHQDRYLTKVWRQEEVLYGDLIARFRTKVLSLGALDLEKLERLYPGEDGERIVHSTYFQSLHRHIHDYVKYSMPEASALLPKMSGEANLCDNVVVACCLIVIAVVLRPLAYLPSLDHFGSLFTLRRLQQLLILAGVVFVARAGAKFRHRQLIRRELSFLALLLAKQDYLKGAGTPPAAGKGSVSRGPGSCAAP